MGAVEGTVTSVNDWVADQAAMVRLERLQSMLEYARYSLEPDANLWERMYALAQMLQGEISRQEESQQLSAYRRRRI